MPAKNTYVVTLPGDEPNETIEAERAVCEGGWLNFFTGDTSVASYGPSTWARFRVDSVGKA